MTCRSLAVHGSVAVWILTVASLAWCSRPEAAAAGGCGVAGYAYAGVQDARTAHGIRATLVTLAQPNVAAGHVAAWVGVGGRELGPGGTDAWIQVGISAFEDGVSNLYYEVTRPTVGPRYTELVRGVPVGSRYRVAVLEVAGRPDWWRVWLNGAPASEPVRLPQSSGRWRPTATAEAWGGERRACNRFAYRFEHVGVLLDPGGAWATLQTGFTFEDARHRVRPAATGAFVARTAATPA
jgi:hypothetical protein